MLPICILAIRDDDDRAYMTRLFVKYQRLMYRTIYDILGDKWATEDVLQTTLLRLIDHLDTLRRLEPEGLAGYIAAACRHTAYNAVRDSSRHPWLPLDGGPEVPDERQEVEDRVLRRLELDALAQVWPRLDENTRWLLEARYILDYSDGELARELGVKPDSVRMALTRARKGPPPDGESAQQRKRMNPGAPRRGSYVLREVRNETGSVGFSGRTAPSYGGCAGPGPGWPRRAADATASCRSGCRGRWCGGADPAPDSPASGPQTAGPRSSCRPG